MSNEIVDLFVLGDDRAISQFIDFSLMSSDDASSIGNLTELKMKPFIKRKLAKEIALHYELLSEDPEQNEAALAVIDRYTIDAQYRKEAIDIIASLAWDDLKTSHPELVNHKGRLAA